MAKKPASTKKSRFGNPAKAAADAAARTHAVPLADVRLERAMEAIAPGFALWLEAQGRDDASIDISLMALDDFFDMYRILEPRTDALSLLPAAAREVMEVSADANPKATLALLSGVRDYVDYLVQASLWTGTPGELSELADVFKLPDKPGLDPAVELKLGSLLPAGDGAQIDDFNDPADIEFPAIYIPGLSAELFMEAAAASPLWKNTLALLTWIGDGKDTSIKGLLRKKDRADAAATLSHTGAGILGEAALSSTTAAELEAETSDRLKLYWHLLSGLGLVEFQAGSARISSRAQDCLDHPEPAVEVFREMLDQFIFISTLTGSEPGVYDDWHFTMATFMAQCASENPPTPEVLAAALRSPDTADGELFVLAKNVASWAAEGLVTVGEHVEVPPAFRLNLVEMLREDFGVVAAGPGAGLDLTKLLNKD
ncbi:hypothetical protein [Arthrobacter sp. GMC3]|uniref:hypothetical protein n=1 Tax=Arthrobacter sp. GMC3 TaxID=2058894 RepID=UPI000CE3F10A|nr:hypothetical protein [Arthrobacter sp. GMC3]